MSKTTNIMLTGVGGQGVLLASEIISQAALEEGFDVKKSEVHGMAQRGGSVVSNVTYGEKVYSPLIAKGEADLLLAFEPLEALRWANYLKSDGKIITNTQRIDPLPVAIGEAEYPANIMDRLEETGYEIISIDALDIATDLGNQKVVNTVLIGQFTNFSEISQEVFKKVVKESVPPKTVDLNLKAFNAGNEY
ncbi:indolepyruvate oxidoreductase subunit beta [Acetohalobium arabaticum]|uniref:Indolepyruvate ferredoxin oxidoreductase subunit beta n=1 Tax=Acetohalobium arabaticum (strain ATCC 49924 / DSM 5501 / Z-7288) TaxID=574087 RepID=D9QSD3_ACEAZ|nr:indolepyruvate oxidoreductase subunit beta [Acetohalobium arabaticum]ADL13396.1 indolepyruvate ferredoxin oxidoreductase, beta subunit [Acetohalobium arabaticum DSM 5501]